MLQLTLFFVLLLLLGTWDLRSMVKAGLKKEIVSYCVLMLAAGSVGLFYLSNPYRQSIAYWIFRILSIKG